MGLGLETYAGAYVVGVVLVIAGVRLLAVLPGAVLAVALAITVAAPSATGALTSCQTQASPCEITAHHQSATGHIPCTGRS